MPSTGYSQVADDVAMPTAVVVRTKATGLQEITVIDGGVAPVNRALKALPVMLIILRGLESFVGWQAQKAAENGVDLIAVADAIDSGELDVAALQKLVVSDGADAAVASLVSAYPYKG